MKSTLVFKQALRLINTIIAKYLNAQRISVISSSVYRDLVWLYLAINWSWLLRRALNKVFL